MPCLDAMSSAAILFAKRALRIAVLDSSDLQKFPL